MTMHGDENAKKLLWRTKKQYIYIYVYDIYKR